MGKVLFPAVACSAGHNAVVAVYYAEWACVVGGVRLSAVPGGGRAFFGQAYQSAVVVFVGAVVVAIVVGLK